MNKFFKIALIAAFILPVFTTGVVASAAEADFRLVTDSRGVKVKVPRQINRVITISDGLVEGMMTILGEGDKIVALGSEGFKKEYSYSYPTVKRGDIVYKKGMTTVALLNRRLAKLPLIATWNTMPNYEKIASLDPDVMIIRVGSCWHWKNEEQVPKSISRIESLGVPMIILYGPNTYDKPEVSVYADEIRIIGQIFGKVEQADKVARFLMEQIQLVVDRTRDIPDKEKPSVMIFGLSPQDRKNGAAGNVICSDHIETYFLEKLVNARSACRETGGRKVMSTEQILALDPDAIVLRTSWGYHPPEELYEAIYYQNLQDLRAIKDKRVVALPYTPNNCDKRLEFPIDVMVMAKAAYPKRFADIDLAAWLLDFYQGVYGVNRETAKKLRAAQWMEWTLH